MIIIVRRLLLVVALVVAGCDPDPTPDESVPPTTGPGDPAAAEPAAPGRGDVEEEGPVVVFLGTSLTAGLGLDGSEEGYVARVDALADSAGLPIRAVNAGVSGETSAGGLRRLDWVLRRPLDVLVVELGANDGLRGQDPAALEDNLRAIIRRTRTRYPGTPVLIAGMEAPPNLGPAYTEAFRAVFPRVARDTGAGLVPFLLEGVAGVPELNQPDGIHPTPRGHARMAEILWPHLEPLVRSVEDGAETGAPR
jgi:acyl-CoA thioesterase-1